jgi:hypothetical protein
MGLKRMNRVWKLVFDMAFKIISLKIAKKMTKMIMMQRIKKSLMRTMQRWLL